MNILKATVVVSFTALLIACSTAQGIPSEETDFTINTNTIRISQNNGNPIYVLDGKTYQWEQLSDSQRERLTVVNKKISMAEAKITQMEKEFQPLIDAIEQKAEEMEQIADRIEMETQALENIDTMSLKEIRETSERVEAIVRANEQEMRALESAMRVKEGQMREIELKYLGKEHETARELERYVDEVVEILKNG